MSPPDSQAGPGPYPESLQRVLRPLLLLTSVFFLNFLGRQMAGPLLPAMEADLGVGHAMSGLFIFCVGMGSFAAQLSAGYLSAFLSYRGSIMLSLWGLGAAIASLAWCPTPGYLILGFLLVGYMGGLYAPTGIALISNLTRPGDWGKALAIHELAPNLGLVAAPLMAAFFLAVADWRAAFAAMGLAIALAGGVYWRWGKGGEARPPVPNFSRLKEVVTDASFWVVVGLLSLAVGVEIGVYSMLPLFLVNERGFDLAEANFLVGISRVPALVMVLAAGWITDRLSLRTTLYLVFGLTGAALMLLALGPEGLAGPMVFAQAAIAACMFPPILAAASAIGKEGTRNLTIALSLALAPVLGGGVMPAGIALAGEWGSFSLGLAVAAGLIMAGALLATRLRVDEASRH